MKQKIEWRKNKKTYEIADEEKKNKRNAETTQKHHKKKKNKIKIHEL